MGREEGGGFWMVDGETVETVSDFIFGGSKITADGDCTQLKDVYSFEGTHLLLLW